MKILTFLIISLAAFILGYSVAEYTDAPSRTYVIKSNKSHFSKNEEEKNFQIYIKDPQPSIQFVSNEKPSEAVKSISLDTFLGQIDALNTIQKKQAVIKIIFQGKKGLIHTYALLTDLLYDKENNVLRLNLENYANIKGSNETNNGDFINFSPKHEVKDLFIIIPY